jgi:hypothetical protein
MSLWPYSPSRPYLSFLSLFISNSNSEDDNFAKSSTSFWFCIKQMPGGSPERDLMRKLLERGDRVQGQVGSLGFRIDMVIEGANGARFAVECDGDWYHGP